MNMQNTYNFLVMILKTIICGPMYIFALAIPICT